MEFLANLSGFQAKIPEALPFFNFRKHKIKNFSARLFGGFALVKLFNDKKIVLLGKLS